MCDWLTAPTSRDLSGTSDLHENIIFWIILHSHSCAITIFFYEAFEFCLYSILQILVGNIHSTKQYFKTYHQQKPVLIYLKSESCNINISQSTKRAWSGRRCEKPLSRLRSRLSRDRQSANSEKSYKRISLISLWRPVEKHRSTCRAS